MAFSAMMSSSRHGRMSMACISHKCHSAALRIENENLQQKHSSSLLSIILNSHDWFSAHKKLNSTSQGPNIEAIDSERKMHISLDGISVGFFGFSSQRHGDFITIQNLRFHHQNHGETLGFNHQTGDLPSGLCQNSY